MDDETTLADVVIAIDGLAEAVENLVGTITEMQGRYTVGKSDEHVFLRTYDESRHD